MRMEILDFLNDRKRRGASPRTIEWHRQVLTWFMEWAETQWTLTATQGIACGLGWRLAPLLLG